MFERKEKEMTHVGKRSGELAEELNYVPNSPAIALEDVMVFRRNFECEAIVVEFDIYSAERG